MKSIFLCFELCLICCLRESITCVFHSIPSTLISLSLLVQSFFVNMATTVSFLYSFLSLCSFLLEDCPVLGLLDSSRGFPTAHSIAYARKGFHFFLFHSLSFIHHLKECRCCLVLFHSHTLFTQHSSLEFNTLSY